LEGVVMNPSFWSGKRVLVTGHTGFKGGWLVLCLREMGARVWGYALEPPTTPNLFETARVSEGMTSVVADIRDPVALRQVVADAQPEVVFHLAAQSLVRFSYAEPVETFDVNVMGTAHVLQAVLEKGTARAVVAITSDKCYENREWLWGYREDEPMGGADPYAASKGAAELLIASYRRSFFDKAGISLASARAGNVIGGGDWADDRIIPDFVRAVSAGRTLQIRNPGAIRPWQHVIDPVLGYMRLAERMYSAPKDFAEGWNFGPDVGSEQSVRALIEGIVTHWGSGARYEVMAQDSSAPHEAHYLKLDSSKARMRLDWRPRWGFDEALAATASWYKAHANSADMRAFTLAQIGARSATHRVSTTRVEIDAEN
jgi:CDP-glucose 4,6-dehydratase